MRIGIVGAGAAGLTTAWLLEASHDVTLFERAERWGGHARTIEIERDGARIAVETGFEFFHRQMWPTFNRLLSELGVPLREYPMRVTVFRTDRDQAIAMPPWGLDGRITLSTLSRLSNVGPRNAARLAQFALGLLSVSPLMLTKDTSITVRQAMARARGLMSRELFDGFFFPHLLASWCLDPEEFMELAAYDVFRYAFMSLSPRGTLPFQEIVGGMRAYIDALLAQSPSALRRQPAEITSIERDQETGTFTLREHDGRSHSFDQLVLATNAAQAAVLLREVRGAAAARALLERVEYFKTTIAVHGDRRLMPPHERDWGIVNMRYDGTHSQSTVWKPGRGDLFRSWVSYDAQLPSALHEVVTFEHAKVTPRYFETQRALQALQGEGGVWLAGNYMHDVDSHESAILSAMNVVRRLAPSAPRLAKLT